MATANMKDVKRRIKSVESTMQITKAMQLVAASKLSRANDRAVAVQPVFETLFNLTCIQNILIIKLASYIQMC